ncbi:MAG: hypothetical protein AAGC71_05925 [Pseudomonadota bacterium]
MPSETPSGWLADLWLPLSPRGGLAALAIFAVLHWLASAAGLLGLFLMWVLLFGFSRFLIDVLVARSVDHPWPVPSAESFNPFHEWWRFGIAVLAVFTLAVAYAFASSGPLWALLALVILAHVPAALALSAIDADPARWFDIPSQWRFVRRVGSSAYARLVVVWLVVVGLAGLLARGQGLLLSIAIETYAMLALVTSVGGLVYRSREALGLDHRDLPEAREQRETQARLQPRSAMLERAYSFFSRGNEQSGRAVLQELLNDIGAEPLDWLVDELRGWEDPRALLLVAPLAIDRRLAAGDDVAALALADECARRDPVFVRQFRNRPVIATLARRLGRDDVAAKFDG